MDKFKEILSQVSDDVLTEESKTAIIGAFDEAVDGRVAERVKLEVTEALTQLDEKHSTQLEKLLESIDDDHSKKLQKVVKKIDEDHCVKLQQIVETYEGMQKNEAEGFRNQLVDEISNYMELYIDKMIPVKQIAEASENTQSKNLIEEIKKIVSVDEEFITNNIKEALEEGREKINTLHKELNEAVKENVMINKNLKSIKSDLILEQKTKSMQPQKKNYITKMLDSKSPEYITENFEYVVEMFEKAESDEAEVLTEEARENVVSKGVTPPTSELIDESVSDSEVNDQSGPTDYITELQRLDYKR